MNWPQVTVICVTTICLTLIILAAMAEGGRRQERELRYRPLDPIEHPGTGIVTTGTVTQFRGRGDDDGGA
jgi:hypothetical protein